MSNTLWKIKAIKDWSAVAKRMEVEVVVQNRTGKPCSQQCLPLDAVDDLH